MKNILLQQFRQSELEKIRHIFSADLKVLEIGGANGFQARILSSWGCDVTSIDIDNKYEKYKHGEQYYPVDIYDGQNIPFPDSHFDVIFSSNVLEHIKDISKSLSEFHRVLKPNGLSVHVLPTPSWRIWTSLTRYIYLLRNFKKYSDYAFFGKQSKIHNTNIVNLQKRSIMKILEKILLGEPHGEYPNTLSELYYFSQYRWVKLFEKHGFKVKSNTKSGIFYTGYTVFPFLNLRMRKLISHFFGSSCCIYFLKKT